MLLVNLQNGWRLRNQLRRPIIFCMLCLALATGCVRRPVVVFMSDFGLQNEAVGLCHGAMLRVAPELQIVDLTHQVPAFDIEQGARVLARATTFPPRTVFVSVIDPGVGTARRPIAIETKTGNFFIAPNNGLLTEVINTQGLKAACEIEPISVNRNWKPGTFDGRDLFAPAAAKLARTHALSRLGPPLVPEQIKRLRVPAASMDAAGTLHGHYIRTDQPYGNVWTDLDRTLLEQAGLQSGMTLDVRFGDQPGLRIPLVGTFGDVPEGQPLGYINSEGRLAFAINLGNFQVAHGLQPGMTVEVRRATPAP